MVKHHYQMPLQLYLGFVTQLQIHALTLADTTSRLLRMALLWLSFGGYGAIAVFVDVIFRFILITVFGECSLSGSTYCSRRTLTSSCDEPSSSS
jgi:hypothetical protein